MAATDAAVPHVSTLEKPARGAGALSDHIDGNGIPEVPEPGRVVHVRGSTWAVADAREQALPRSPADETEPRFQHLVALASLDEDRLGEELTVVWELEVGHTVSPEQGLPTTVSPDAFDDPHTLGAFVDAVRWGAVTSADPSSYQAPFRSGANVEAYQLEPLRRALQAPRTNLLLADDVGLGKTIEAGLVIQELLLRHRARTVVVVCPPSLSLKWQDEMREKFGLDFVIVDSALMAQVRRTHGLAANPFRLFPRLIVSMAWLPSVRAQRLLRDVYAEAGQPGSARRFAFDALVVDEAHHVAPASPSALGGGRGYAVDSQRKSPRASWPPAASTGSSSPRRRTTATPSRSPPCSRWSTTAGSAVARRSTSTPCARSPCAGSRARSPTSRSSLARSRRCRSSRRARSRRRSRSCRRCWPTAPAPTAANAPATSSPSCSRSACSPAHGRSPARSRTTRTQPRAAGWPTRTTSTTPRCSAAARATRRRACSSTPSSSRCARARAPTRSSRRRPRSWTGCCAGHAGSSTGRTRGSPRCSRCWTRYAVPTGARGPTSAWSSSPSTSTRSTGSSVCSSSTATPRSSRRSAEHTHGRARDRPGAVHRAPGQGPHAGARRHRRRRGGHRPAGALPPAGQLRRAVQPVPAGAADRADRPVRPAVLAGGLLPRADVRVEQVCRRRRLPAPDRREGQRGRERPRLGQPGHRRRHPGALLPLGEEPGAARRAGPQRRDHHQGARRRDGPSTASSRRCRSPTSNARWRCT